MTAGARWFEKRPLLLAGSLVVLCVLAVEWPFLWTGRVPSAQDNLHLFYPLNHLTGRALRAGELPVWNIHQMAGMPLMGDPEAGWGSLVTMLSYTLLPLARAAGVVAVVYLALAGVGALLFFRSAGTSISGATLGALAYTFSSQMLAPHIDLAYGNLSYEGTLAWLPWMLLGVNLAVCQDGRTRLAGWALTAFAGSQEVSVWLGQGAYYAFGATAAYVCFQTLLGAPAQPKSPARRVADLALHSTALATLTVALSAWTLFPRLELLLVSNLSGGYSAGQQQFEGGSNPAVLGVFFQVGKAYIGAVIVLLVLAAPWLRPSRAQWFYLGMAALTYLVSLEWLVKSAREYGVLRAVYGFVPGVLQLHLHYPERVGFVCVFFLAALAGSSLDSLLAAEGRRRLALPAAIATVVVTLLLLDRASSFAALDYCVFGAGLGVSVAVILLCWRRRLVPPWTRTILLVLTVAELVGSVTFAHVTEFRPGDPQQYYVAPGSSRAIVLLRSAAGSGRFFGYDRRAVEEPYSGYRRRWPGPLVRELLVAAQATVLGLEDAQGYNPMHLQVYDRLLAVANGRPQENYRSAYVLPSGLKSPLLDMLNTRYVLVRKGTKLGPKYEPALNQGRLRLYKNTRALPRAWVVHSAIFQDDDEQALRAIHDGVVDPRTAALVSRPPESLGPPTGVEQVSITRYLPGRIEMNVRLSAPGLVVLSELDYTAWKVKVDGEPRPVIRANGALRSVAAPAGEHAVTWYYDSSLTRLGFWLSGLSIFGLAAVFLLWPRRVH